MTEASVFLKEKSEEILKKMGIPARAEVSEQEGRVLVDLTPKEEGDSSFLIGFHGQTLNALQTVLRVMLVKKTGEFVPFSLESGGYRRQQEEELQRRALEAADKARFLLKEVSFPAMPAAERRIIHVVLQKEKGIYTESRGEGRERHVVVIPGEREGKS
uniref:KH domain-containing protein n=1 Tax=candidate division WWE3 bacterium TaxID=2053526 RepID=A0A832E0M6_UNCKA